MHLRNFYLNLLAAIVIWLCLGMLVGSVRDCAANTCYYNETVDADTVTFETWIVGESWWLVMTEDLEVLVDVHTTEPLRIQNPGTIVYVQWVCRTPPTEIDPQGIVWSCSQMIDFTPADIDTATWSTVKAMYR